MPQKDPEARRAYQAAYRAIHKEKLLANNKQYQREKREKIRAQRLQYRLAHRDQINATAQRYRLAHREKLRNEGRARRAANRAQQPKKAVITAEMKKQRQQEYRARYYAANREKIKAYRIANRDRYAIIRNKKRARKRHSLVNDLTTAQWRAIVALYDHCCVYCGRHMQRLTIDHILPLSKGGTHTVQNVVPACASCNSRKHTGPPLCPVQPLLFA